MKEETIPIGDIHIFIIEQSGDKAAGERYSFDEVAELVRTREQITSAPLLKRIEDLEEIYWHDDMVLRFAELYRWSSTRFTIKAFKESKDWKSVNIDDARAMQNETDQLQKRISELEGENERLIRLVPDHPKAMP